MGSARPGFQGAVGPDDVSPTGWIRAYSFVSAKTRALPQAVVFPKPRGTFRVGENLPAILTSFVDAARHQPFAGGTVPLRDCGGDRAYDNEKNLSIRPEKRVGRVRRVCQYIPQTSVEP